MKVALTGGATGIGAAAAAQLKEAGHEVTAFDIHEPTKNVDKWIRTDLSDPVSIAAAVVQAEGPYDALLNNAGLPPREGLEEVILKVNFFGQRTFMEGMLDKLKPGASIVNTSSRAGALWRDNIEVVKALMDLDLRDLPKFIADRGIDPTRAYNLSKEAVTVFTFAETERLLARDLRINSVCPSAVETDIHKDFVAAFGERVEKNIARVGRPGTPEEIASVIVFVASPESHWIKGQELTVDGGTGAMVVSDTLGLRPYAT